MLEKNNALGSRGTRRVPQRRASVDRTGEETGRNCKEKLWQPFRISTGWVLHWCPGLDGGEGLILTFFENTGRNRSFQEFYTQAYHQDIVQLTDDWDEIWDKLDRTDNIENRTPAAKLRVPRHLGVNQRPPDGVKLLQQLPG
jgi:hypothetical protein